VADGNPATLGAELFDASQIIITAVSDPKTAEGVLTTIPGATRIEPLPTAETGTVEFLVESEKGSDIRQEIFAAFAAKKLPLIGMRVKNATLEEIFLELTTGVKEAVR
jgi:ABC-2 type transport system ATP-binding protein